MKHVQLLFLTLYLPGCGKIAGVDELSVGPGIADTNRADVPADGLDSASDGFDERDSAPIPSDDSGTAGYKVQVEVVGKGSISSVPAGIDCRADSGTCQFLFGEFTQVRLLAKPDLANRFGGMSDCIAPQSDCAYALPRSSSPIRATFVDQPYNLAFVTPDAKSGNLGGRSGANSICQSAAIRSRLPGKYVAWLSDKGADQAATPLLDGAIVRLDGLPIATSKRDLLLGRILHSPTYQADGTRTAARYWTNTLSAGTAANASDVLTCAGWTSNVDLSGGILDNTPVVGAAAGGARVWTQNGADVRCDSGARLLCIGIDSKVEMPPPVAPSGSRWMFVSHLGSEVSPKMTLPTSVANLQVLCTLSAARVGRMGSFEPFVSTVETSAYGRVASSFPPGTRMYRPDGVDLGTMEDIAIGNIRSGLWVTTEGAYIQDNQIVQTGSRLPNLTSPPMGELNCKNWTAVTSDKTLLGTTNLSDAWFALEPANPSARCNAIKRVFCVQTK